MLVYLYAFDSVGAEKEILNYISSRIEHTVILERIYKLHYIILIIMLYYYI